MPEPDVVLELHIGDECPDDKDLQIIQDVAKAGVPLGDTARAVVICSDRPQFDKKVLSIGLWADDGGDSVAQLENALIAAGPLIPGRGAALLFTPTAIQYLASTAWSKVPKKIDADIGFIRLNNDIHVAILDHRIITTVTGQYKLRFLPNIPFTITVQDLLSLLIVGSDPPLKADPNTRFAPNTIKYALIATLISPLLGGLIFWQGDNLLESLASPPNTTGAGGALAAQWPPQILTTIAPPPSILQGKITFLWTDFAVDDRGVRTLGAFVPAKRIPMAFIYGPRAITVQLPAHSTTTTYQLVTQDLRGPLKIQWSIDGVLAGRAAVQEVRFETPGVDPDIVSRRLRVEVNDVDGLTATHELEVRFEAKVPPDKQPF